MTSVRYRRRVIRLVFALAAVVAFSWPMRARACSCVEPKGDRSEILSQAREAASVIYLARVTSIIDGERGRQTASVEVLEPFKATFPAGTKLHLPTGGHGDCTFPFRAGRTYVVYDFGGYCSRTREIADAKTDVELNWLRTGVLPPSPKALRRETVRCDVCDLFQLARSLVGRRVFVGKNVDAAVSSGEPFWISGFDKDAPVREVAVGRARDGGLFELVQTPFDATREACRQRVVKRSCERLETALQNTELALRCVAPGPEVELCNEESSRSSSWGPLEELSAASCNWRDPAVGNCRLSETLKPMREQSNAPRAILRCSPQFGRGGDACVVVQQAE